MSTGSLPPFSGEHPPCQKCGMRDAHTEYVPLRPAVYERGRVVSHTVDEYLRRTCCRCSYAWAEACVKLPEIDRRPT